nr:hypothetical protein [uncultured Brevundimonas sp.]
MKRIVAAVVFAILLTAARQGDVNPWFGSWSLRAEDAGGEPETLIYSDAGNGAMRMESVEAGSVVLTRFDGVPAADTGSAQTSGGALAVKAISPTRYSWVFFKDGQPFVEGVNTLSEDSRSFTEVSWRVGQPDKTVTLTYERR